MIDLLVTVLWFLIAISVLVAIHEFGHFFVARLCNVKVLRFSIGFGHRIVSWTDKKGTEFAVSAIPLGGYVKMLDERETDIDPSDKAFTYNSKTVQQRIAIAMAGPLANFILAILLYWAIFLRGTVDYSPVIGHVDPNSFAALGGLEAGQEIISVDSVSTPSRRAVAEALIDRLGESGFIEFVVKYEDSDLTYQAIVPIQSWLRGEGEPEPVSGLGLSFFEPKVINKIVAVSPDSPAERAGILVGDIPVEANGIRLNEWSDWVEQLVSRANQSVNVVVKRDLREVSLDITPEAINIEGKTIGRIGVSASAQALPKEMIRRNTYGFIEAIPRAISETYSTSTFVLLSLKKLILGEISTKALSGPIGIAKVAASQAERGIWSFVSFLAHLSVVLGIFNLLPIPVLDGGHILFCIIEWIKGKPVSERAQVFGLKLGMSMLLCVTAVAFYNDILRL